METDDDEMSCNKELFKSKLRRFALQFDCKRLFYKQYRRM